MAGTRGATDVGPVVPDERIASSLTQLPRTTASIARPRLLEKLSRAVPGGVLLVSGEPASGKTTLVVDWLRGLRAESSRIAWLTLPVGLDDDALFWRHLLAPIEHLGVEVDDLRAAVADESTPSDPWLTTLANRLGRIAPGIVIVVDDLHELRSAVAHEALRRLVDRLPPSVTFVMVSRVEPPWELVDWRMSGRLEEVRSADLRFARDEMEQFFHSATDLTLSDEDVTRLHDRTEGWAGGVKLAALSMQRAADPHTFVEQFAADDELVSTYLVRDVLDRQDAEVREFLLDVSVLRELSVDLCDELRDREDSGQLLEHCRAHSLFVSELDNRGTRFRMHPLFAELLRARLEATDRARLVRLHLAASHLFERRGELADAVHHAEDSGDERRLSALMERYAGGLANQGKFDDIEAMIAPLRRIARGGRAEAVVGLAGALTVTGGVEEALGLVDALLGDELAPRDRLAALQVRGFAQMASGRVARLTETARELRDLDPVAGDSPPPFDEQRFSSYLAGVGHFFEGDLPAAGRWFAEAARHDARKGLFYVEVPGWRALVAAQTGALDEAERFAADAESRQDEMHSAETAVAVPGFVARAVVALERDRIERAHEQLERARRTLRPLFWESVIVESVASRLPHAGGAKAALSSLEEMAQISLGPHNSAVLDALVAERAVDLNLRLGDLSAARRWASEYERARSSDLPAALAIRLAVASGAPDLRESIEVALQRDEPVPLRIDTLLAAAHAEVATGDVERARQLVARAAALAEPEGMVRRFVVADPAVRDLVNHLIEEPVDIGHGSAPSAVFLTRLTGLFRTARPAPITSAPAVEGMVEQLSPRELDVLRQLATGRSYTEIGASLFVSRNTVKSHVRHVYTKLGVASRIDAIGTAQRLGLL